MPFPVHDLATAPGGSRELLVKMLGSYGFLPNLAGVLAESPATLKGYLAAMGAFDSEEMNLTPLERQVLLLAVSVKNGCDYCAAAHSMLAHKNGLDSLELDRLQQGRPLGDSRLEALRRFAEAVVEQRGRVDEEAVQRFLHAGFSRAEALEVVFGVAIKTLTNYTAHLARPAVNAQFAAFLPGRTAAMAGH